VSTSVRPLPPLLGVYWEQGLQTVSGVLVADITSLQWRAAIQAAITAPNIINGFLAGPIAEGVNAFGGGNGWRWGYGMFAILVPICIAPAVTVLFWGDYRAKKLGGKSYDE
jgi:MFS family permease